MKRPNLILNLILITLFCITSCSDKTSTSGTEDVVTITIDENSVSDFSLSEIFSDFEIVKLEEGETLIGEVRNFKIRGNRIYILSHSKIFTYSLNGELLNLIDKKGRGPDEYQSAWDFAVDDNGNIYISDFRGKSIVKYDKNGEFSDTWNCGFYFTAIELYNDDFYLFTGFSNYDNKFKEYSAYKFDNWGDKEPIGKYLKNDPNIALYRNFMDHNNFYPIYGELLFGVTGFDTIFALRDSILKPIYAFNYNIGKISEDVYSRSFTDVREFSNFVRDKELSHYAFYFMSTPDFLFSKYRHSGKNYLNIYDKATSKNRSCNSIIDDLFLPDINHSFFEFFPLAYHDSWYYFLYQPFEITEYLDNKGYDRVDLTKVSKEFLSSIRAEDNPVILRLK